MKNTKHLLPPLKNVAWALAFAVGIWWVVSVNVSKTEAGHPVRLRVVDIPKDDHGRDRFVVDFAAMSRVDIRGPRLAFTRLSSEAKATLSFDELEEGENSIPVAKFALGGLGSWELSADERSFKPPVVKITVSRVVRKAVRVRAAFTSPDPPAGWVWVENPTVTPPFVEVSGAPANLATIGGLETTSLDIASQLEALGFQPTGDKAIQIPFREVELESPKDTVPSPETVEVAVSVKPEPVEVVLEGLKPTIACDPAFDWTKYRIQPDDRDASITVTLRGPSGVVANKAKLREVEVLAKLTSDDAASLDKLEIPAAGRTRPATIAVHAPAGLEWVRPEEVGTYRVLVFKVARETAGPGG